jgi:hypothetical protein
MLVFDVDDTLVKRFTTKFLPGVQERLSDVGKIVLATNQGGPALRMWMEAGRWGDPERFPTVEQVLGRLANIGEAVKAELVVIALAYQSKKGAWAPACNRSGSTAVHSNDRLVWSFDPDWRKPDTGMLDYISSTYGLTAEDITFVGNGDEDLAAAEAFGCEFIPADEFFMEMI